MDYLFKFIKDEIKKIDDFSFDDHNFDFLNETRSFEAKSDENSI